MKYLIMIWSNPASRAAWAGFTDAERASGLDVYAALNEEIVASGEKIVSEALADVSLSKCVTVRDGQAMATDGPHAEVKEQLAGFFLVDCDSMDRAIEVAARVPEAEFGLVEVRPVLDMSGLEM